MGGGGGEGSCFFSLSVYSLKVVAVVEVEEWYIFMR